MKQTSEPCEFCCACCRCVQVQQSESCSSAVSRSADERDGTSLSSERAASPSPRAAATTCCGCPCRLGANIGQPEPMLAAGAPPRGACENVQCFCACVRAGDARQRARAIISRSRRRCCCWSRRRARHICVRAASAGQNRRLMRSSERMHERDYANRQVQATGSERKQRSHRHHKQRRHQSVESAAAAAHTNLALNREVADNAPSAALERVARASSGHRSEPTSCDETCEKLCDQQKSHEQAGASYQGDSHCARRPTLAGRLIELFEQQVGVCGADDETTTTTARQDEKPNSAAAAHQINKSQQASKSKQDARHMRDIITPVKWAPSGSGAESTSSSGSCGSCEDDSLLLLVAGATPENAAAAEAQDSLECRSQKLQAPAQTAGSDAGRQQAGATCCCARHKMSRLQASPAERIAARGGVRVLPRDAGQAAAVDAGRPAQEQQNFLLKKLTKTHWQPPTDARKYELRRARPATTQRGETTGRLSTSSPPVAAAVTGPRGTPALIKHQASSSRRLLNQLANLRRGHHRHHPEVPTDSTSRPQGRPRPRRPESVARVEELIEQLERAACEWQEDEQLLERAERRDFVAQVEESQRRRRRQLGQAKPEMPPTTTTSYHEDLLNFGCRQDAPSRLEAQSIEKSHSGSLVRLGGACRAPSCGRQADDLALRRLASPRQPSTTTATHRPCGTLGPPCASYLLCANGSTGAPAQIDAKRNSLERRLRHDDLALRRCATSRGGRQLAPASPELPFGIPRDQSTQTLARLSASERLASAASGQRGELGARQREFNNEARNFLGHPSCDEEEEQSAEKSQLQPKQNPQVCTSTTKRTTRSETTRITRSTTTTTTTKHQLEGEDGGRQAAQRAIVVHEPGPEVASSATAAPVTRRSDSRVSFAGDAVQDAELGAGDTLKRRAANCSSADSGLGVVSPTATPTPVRDQQLDYAEQQLEDFELLEIAGLLGSPDCESSAPLERVQAELGETARRQRPRINIDQPRAKSPLLRAGSTRARPRPLSFGHLRPPVGEAEPARRPKQPPPPHETVVIQTYSDSLQRRRRRPSTAELECQYEFSDEADSGEDLPASPPHRPPLATYESPQSRSPPGSHDELGDELASLRLLDRAIESHTTTTASKAISNRERTPPLPPPQGVRPRSRDCSRTPPPRFSIGQYRTLGRRRDLIILT